MNKIGYKVVWVSLAGELISAVMTLYGTIQYLIGEWVAPLVGCGPICIFRTKEAAITFRHWVRMQRYSGAYKIFKCEYQQSEERCVYIPDRTVLIGTTGEALESLPEKTILADKVKLLEEV